MSFYYCLLHTLPHHFPLLSSSSPKSHFSVHQCCYSSSNKKWDPSAESFTTQKKNFNFKNNPRNANRYYYDDVVEDYDDDDDDEEEEDDSDFVGGDVLEEYIDSIWIFKVFGTYGWFLPFIIVSMLVASGPKAFLMALALPLGQSTLSFAFQKLWGGKDSRSKRKTRTKKTSPSRRPRTVQGKKTGKGKKMGYQTWVPKREFTANEPSGERGATSSFGGWDELDARESDLGRGTPAMGRSRKTSPGEEGKFGTIRRKGETPLLLRLLVSVFPFLSSWTRML